MQQLTEAQECLNRLKGIVNQMSDDISFGFRKLRNHIGEANKGKEVSDANN